MYFIIIDDIETSTRHYIPGDLLNMQEMSPDMDQSNEWRDLEYVQRMQMIAAYSRYWFNH